MSAFVVSNATIEAIVSYFYWRSMGSEGKLEFDLPDDDHARKLCMEMLALNIASVAFRYPDGTNMDEPKAPERWKLYSHYDSVTVFKQLECFLYQACELPEPPELYERLSKAKEQLACEIARQHPIYDKAPWGIPS